MASTFEALAEPRRREILDLLRRREHLVGELVTELRLAQPTVSKHLKILRGAGLVEVRHDAQRRWYRLRPQPLTEIDLWLAPYRQLWDTSLDALARHLDVLAADDSTPSIDAETARSDDDE
ncbi:ArsR/SmtB family transcription factor [Nocardia mikamii]|uniref:ArsR/SmtB family transcription factor n=1 Tax=Nocardia mikamii TaxID=508464 RepID=UPI0007A41125|nr:metalloregulator ArsR/SmtB family transcription factor [Nocardia mikamii]